jgi:hypothetical protein
MQANLIIANALATALMTGVLWIIQLLHYPMFLGLQLEQFLQWHQFHTRRITPLVAPLMIFEFVVGGYLCWLNINNLFFYIFSLTVLVWLSTFLLSVPLHQRLEKNNFNKRTVDLLVLTNWPRTLFYSVKFILVAVSLKKFVG